MCTHPPSLYCVLLEVSKLLLFMDEWVLDVWGGLDFSVIQLHVLLNCFMQLRQSDPRADLRLSLMALTCWQHLARLCLCPHPVRRRRTRVGMWGGSVCRGMSSVPRTTVTCCKLQHPWNCSNVCQGVSAVEGLCASTASLPPAPRAHASALVAGSTFTSLQTHLLQTVPLLLLLSVLVCCSYSRSCWLSCDFYRESLNYT